MSDDEPRRQRVDLRALFASKPFLRIAAPMVRYSKLAFRLLVREYGTDLTFTPMIIAESFNRSAEARDSDFTTHVDDSPLIVQFAANKPTEFALAAQKVAPYCDAVDLNCGCPQSWAMGEGIGAKMISTPQLIYDIVRESRSLTADLPVSVKGRCHSDLRRTVDMVRQIESAGAVFISVHGRTPSQRSSVPADWDAIRLLKESVSCPLVANGDIMRDADAVECVRRTGADGVMSARALLANPALYAGYEHTPLACVKRYFELAVRLGTGFITIHHHLMFMLFPSLSRGERRVLAAVSSTAGLVDFLNRFTLLHDTLDDDAFWAPTADAASGAAVAAVAPPPQ